MHVSRAATHASGVSLLTWLDSDDGRLTCQKNTYLEHRVRSRYHVVRFYLDERVLVLH